MNRELDGTTKKGKSQHSDQSSEQNDQNKVDEGQPVNANANADTQMISGNARTRPIVHDKGTQV